MGYKIAGIFVKKKKNQNKDKYKAVERNITLNKNLLCYVWTLL